MEKNTILRYVNKRVKIQLRNNNVYTIYILSVNSSDTLAKDKFGYDLAISNEDIIVIEEVQ